MTLSTGNRILRVAGALCAACAISLTAAAEAADPGWLDRTLLAAAKKEKGPLTVYSSTNEGEGLPLFKIFTDATGIQVSYVRGSDSQLMARMAIEARAGRDVWDVSQTASVHKQHPSTLRQFDPSEAQFLHPGARDKDRRWYGVYANYNTPGYNTKLVKASDLPQRYEDFVKHPEWAGRVAIDFTDQEWLMAMFIHYGEARGRQIVGDIAKTLKPAVTKGHLAMARSVGAGEYAFALNNYTNLTLNVKLAGGATDFWALDPVCVFYGEVGVNARAPNPNAALLAANFLLSKDAQTHLARYGRFPTRDDVTTNPPDALDKLKGRKLVSTIMTEQETRKWEKVFKELFEQR